jgi:hypothetical protein
VLDPTLRMSDSVAITARKKTPRQHRDSNQNRPPCTNVCGAKKRPIPYPKKFLKTAADRSKMHQAKPPFHAKGKQCRKAPSAEFNPPKVLKPNPGPGFFTWPSLHTHKSQRGTFDLKAPATAACY